MISYCVIRKSALASAAPCDEVVYQTVDYDNLMRWLEDHPPAAAEFYQVLPTPVEMWGHA